MKNDTKSAIADALKRLGSKKPINRITINEIAQECGISRMTFYYHFKDIYDLAEWICEQEATRAIAADRGYDTWQQGYLNLLNAIQENRALILNIYRCVDREQIERYMMHATEKLVTDVVNEASKGLTVSDAGKKQVATFYIYAFLGTMLDWIGSGMTAKPEDIVRTASAILQGGFRRSLENMSALEKERG